MKMDPVNMGNDIDHLLLKEEEIKARVAELGREISEDYRGKELLMVGILKGAVVFFSDLIRSIDIPLAIDFMATSRYADNTVGASDVSFRKDLDTGVAGKHVILVEDIVDSGRTLQFLKDTLKTRGAASIRICTLMDKPERREVELNADYIGFTIPNEFVVGYGLDYAEKYRNLKDIGVLKESVYNG